MTLAESTDASTRRPQKSAAAFRTISEVATELDVPPHVLRFWESKFPQIKPLKRGGGRRYYRPEDVELLRRIRELLYRDGYTIKGVQKLLRSPNAKGEVDEVDTADHPAETLAASPALIAEEPEDLPALAAPAPTPAPVPMAALSGPRLPTLALAASTPMVALDGETRVMLDDIVAELEDVRAMLLASARRAPE